MAEVVRASDTLHKHVVDVFLHDMPDQVLEYSDDYPLEGGSDTLQSEGHDLVAEDSSIGGECSLVLVRQVHLHLM